MSFYRDPLSLGISLIMLCFCVYVCYNTRVTPLWWLRYTSFIPSRRVSFTANQTQNSLTGVTLPQFPLGSTLPIEHIFTLCDRHFCERLSLLLCTRITLTSCPTCSTYHYLSPYKHDPILTGRPKLDKGRHWLY